MPTITEARPHRGFPLAATAAVLAAWFLGMAALALAIDPPAVIVFGPLQARLAAVDRADASLLSMGHGFTIARSDRGGLTRRLYAGGAWFVWPALAGMCRPTDIR